MQTPWLEEFVKLKSFEQGMVVNAHSSDRLDRYTYTVRKTSEEEVELPASRLEPLSQTICFTSDEKISSWIKSDSMEMDQGLGGMCKGNPVLILGESEMVVLHGYSYSDKTYEYMDILGSQAFVPTLRRNLSMLSISDYKPLSFILEISCESGQGLDSLQYRYSYLYYRRGRRASLH